MLSLNPSHHLPKLLIKPSIHKIAAVVEWAIGVVFGVEEVELNPPGKTKN
jgi:hypothetical protein